VKQHKFDSNLICPLCGINPAKHDGKKYVSREHIPPECIFIERTADLITVPSCHECNNGTSKYDIEFKIALGLHIGSRASAIWNFTRISLDKTEGRKKRRKEILDNTSENLTDNRFGILGHQYNFPSEPINTAIKKICKGLHWYISGHCLQSDCIVEVTFLANGQQTNERMSSIFKDYGSQLKTGKGAFKAEYMFPNDRTDISIWRLSFYEIPCFEVNISPLGLFQSLNNS